MKFLILASYSSDGAKGVLQTRSGTERKQATNNMITGLGGKMESFYYTGNCDAYVTCDLPDAAAAAAVALTIKASGMGSVSITLLLETEEVDKATTLNVGYSLPGTTGL